MTVKGLTFDQSVFKQLFIIYLPTSPQVVHSFPSYFFTQAFISHTLLANFEIFRCLSGFNCLQIHVCIIPTPTAFNAHHSIQNPVHHAPMLSNAPAFPNSPCCTLVLKAMVMVIVPLELRMRLGSD